MTSPLDSYTRAMDAMTFDEGTKARMAERLRDAADATRARGGAAPGPRRAEVLAMPAKRRLWPRVAASVALALALAGGGTVAVAAGVLPNPADVLSDVFGGAPAQTELIDDVGRPVGASVTSGGVTVTAQAVIGDRSNYTVVYSMEFEDPSVLDGLEPNENGLLPLIADASIYVDGAMSGGGGAYFYDADPTDNVIQYVETMAVSTWDGSSIVGRTARFSMRGIRAFTEEGDKGLVASGEWSLKFEMNYVDTTIDLPTGQTTTWQGSRVTVEAVTVSAVGVTVDYSIDRQMGDLGPSGMMSDAARAEQDAVIGLPVTVTFSDGSTFDATSANSSAEKRDDGGSFVTKSATFDRIVDAGDIVSVTVGEVEIPVSER